MDKWSACVIIVFLVCMAFVISSCCEMEAERSKAFWNNSEGGTRISF